MQAVLGEHHLLSWATISVPLLPIWFWSVVWKHLAFCLPFVDPVPTVMFGSFPSASPRFCFSSYIYRSQLSVLLVPYALSSDDNLDSPVVLRMSSPRRHNIPGKAKQFWDFSSQYSLYKVEKSCIPSLAIWFSTLEMWWRQRVLAAKSEVLMQTICYFISKMENYKLNWLYITLLVVQENIIMDTCLEESCVLWGIILCPKKIFRDILLFSSHLPNRTWTLVSFSKLLIKQHKC